MYILIRMYYKGFDVLMMQMTLYIMVLYNVTTCSLLHSYHVSEKKCFKFYPEDGNRKYARNFGTYVLCKNTRRHIREEKNFRLFLELWLGKSTSFCGEIKCSWIYKQSHIDRGAESSKQIQGLKTCYCTLTLQVYFPYYVPACTENMQIKLTLTLLLVIIQELTPGSRGFLCKLTP